MEQVLGVCARLAEDINAEELKSMLFYATVYVIPIVFLVHMFSIKLFYPLVVRFCTGITEKKKKERFCENAFKMQHYFLSSVMLSTIAWKHFGEWLPELFDCHADDLSWEVSRYVFSLPGGLFDLSLTGMDIVYWAYTFQIGFYIYDAFRLLFVNERIGDFYVMAFHHVTTLTLIIISAATCIRRFGVFIIFIHDVTDVPLYAMKITEYAKWTNVNFVVSVIFAFSFILTRVVFQSILLGMRCYHVGMEVPTYQKAVEEYRFPVEGFIYVMLWFLVVCQVYWSSLIVSKGYRVIKLGDAITDTRETQTKAAHDKKE